jgi:hypothetical protein
LFLIRVKMGQTCPCPASGLHGGTPRPQGNVG